VQNLTIAIVKCDSKFLLDNVTDDIRWNRVGSMIVEGKDNFAEALKKLKEDKAAQLTIHHVATHGKAGAVNGTIKSKNGTTHAICDVYEFSNSKGDAVKEITSYVIEIK
jgi:hypothetical protein